MSNLPNFSEHGYLALEILGHNYGGGRVTYKAVHHHTQESVVIKQFQFATPDATWESYKLIEREIEILCQLNHPGIPRFLHSFQTHNGCCLVQEYKSAKSLATKQIRVPDDIKHIAVSLLGILQYLQEFPSPIIHRDIKPENILVDDQKNVFLVDFGFAHDGRQEIQPSSMLFGTAGFMSPEQSLGQRQLSKASDLYSLGISLICLLTNTKSINVYKLIDHHYRIAPKILGSLEFDESRDFQYRRRLSLRFIAWLQKMVEPDQAARFQNAAAALNALRPLDVIRVPEAQFSVESLEFKAISLGEKLIQTITIQNLVPETVLEGEWEVVPNPKDPPSSSNSHSWIYFNPRKFSGNNTKCNITIDTQNLKAQSIYKRKLALRSNGLQEFYNLNIKVQTAPRLIQKPKIPYASLACVFLVSLISSIILAKIIALSIDSYNAIDPAKAAEEALIEKNKWSSRQAHLENAKNILNVILLAFFSIYGVALLTISHFKSKNRFYAFYRTRSESILLFLKPIFFPALIFIVIAVILNIAVDSLSNYYHELVIASSNLVSNPDKALKISQGNQKIQSAISIGITGLGGTYFIFLTLLMPELKRWWKQSSLLKSSERMKILHLFYVAVILCLTITSGVGIAFSAYFGSRESMIYLNLVTLLSIATLLFFLLKPVFRFYKETSKYIQDEENLIKP